MTPQKKTLFFYFICCSVCFLAACSSQWMEDAIAEQKSFDRSVYGSAVGSYWYSNQPSPQSGYSPQFSALSSYDSPQKSQTAEPVNNVLAKRRGGSGANPSKPLIQIPIPSPIEPKAKSLPAIGP
jgi:hypothetical protein